MLMNRLTPQDILDPAQHHDALLRMTLTLHGTRPEAAATPAGIAVGKLWADGQLTLDAARKLIAAAEEVARRRFDALDAAEHELILEGIDCRRRDRQFDQAYAEGRMTADDIVGRFVAMYDQPDRG